MLPSLVLVNNCFAADRCF